MEKLGEYFFPGEFVSLNEYINRERGHWSKAAQTKKAETMAVYYDLIGKLPIEDYPVKVEFHWSCKDDKKDPDNIAFAKKFILDGMVEARVLAGDTWKHIRGLEDFFKVNPKDVGVTVVVWKMEA
jgi:hypothetical protein